MTSARNSECIWSPTVSWSLEGEDLIASSLLRAVRKGTYLDIGCADPLEISNTYLFYLAGWRGVAVDGRVELSSSWANKRPGDVFVPCILGESDRQESFWTFPDPTMNTCDAGTAKRYAERYSPEHCNVEQRVSRTAKSVWCEVFGQGAPPLIS